MENKINQFLNHLENIVNVSNKKFHETFLGKEFISKDLLSELITRCPKISFFDDENNYSYLPRKINVHTAENIYGILHEFCHFIIATPYQRSLINFGLGKSPTDPRCLPECMIDTSISDVHLPEFYAGILTIVYQEYYGYDTLTCLNEMALNYTFEDNDPVDDWHQALIDMTVSGLITWSDNIFPVPTFKLNDGSLNFGAWSLDRSIYQYMGKIIRSCICTR